MFSHSAWPKLSWCIPLSFRLLIKAFLHTHQIRIEKLKTFLSIYITLSNTKTVFIPSWCLLLVFSAFSFSQSVWNWVACLTARRNFPKFGSVWNFGSLCELLSTLRFFDSWTHIGLNSTLPPPMSRRMLDGYHEYVYITDFHRI